MVTFFRFFLSLCLHRMQRFADKYKYICINITRLMRFFIIIDTEKQFFVYTKYSTRQFLILQHCHSLINYAITNILLTLNETQDKTQTITSN